MMDEIDLRILNCLRANSRQNASAIGEKVNMSVSAVIERIRKMETAGIIVQYTTVLDGKKVGRNVLAYIFTGVEHPKYNDGFAAFAGKHPAVLDAAYITGDFDYLLKVSTASTEDLERVLFDLKSVPGVNDTKTIIVLSVVKNEYSVPV